MNKRDIHHYWVKSRVVKSGYLLIVALVFLIIGLAALRQNNITALRLRNEVVKVDEQNGDVESALRKLRQYIYSHMNTNLASGTSHLQQPIQLKYRYERLVSAEKARVSAANEQIYKDAQNECERRFPAGLSGGSRIPCIEEFVATKSIKEQAIPDSLYKFAFVSPMWSPDLAGISLALSALFLLAALSRYSFDQWLKSKLQEHV